MNYFQVYLLTVYGFLFTSRKILRQVIFCVCFAACGSQADQALADTDASDTGVPASAPETNFTSPSRAPKDAGDYAATGLVELGESARAKVAPAVRGDKASVKAQPLSALAAAVTLELSETEPDLGQVSKLRVRCDGVRIAPQVILTAAHCFAWHRRTDGLASPAAWVSVRSQDASPNALGGQMQVHALHVAIHPKYPALSCTQPSRAAAACLRAAGRCGFIYGRDTAGRSACLHSVSQQVIEAQQGGTYDLALVFVVPAVKNVCGRPGACAILVQEPQAAPKSEIRLYQLAAGDDAWRGGNADFDTILTLDRRNNTRTSFDLVPYQKPDTRLFDGAFAAVPACDVPAGLTAWASREVLDMPVDGGFVPIRYTRLTPHLPWLLDTIASVSRSYPALPTDMPKIAENLVGPNEPDFSAAFLD